MRFLEELREYLDRPWQVGGSARNRRYRRYFLSVLERVGEQGGSLTAIRDRISPRLENYVYQLTRRLRGEGLPSHEIPKLVESAIACEAGLEIPYPLSAARSLILKEARHGLLGASEPTEQVHIIPLYAKEIRLVRLARGGTKGKMLVTQIGRIARELSGRDAIRWLLNVEVALSTGPEDSWRVDRDTLSILATRGKLSPGCDWPVNFASMPRLLGFGLVDQNLSEYLVRSRARSMLREIGESSDTAMAVLVSALLDDDLHSRFPTAGAASASAALSRQTRLVVHEIRNALLPVQDTLRSVDRVVASAGFESSIQSYRGRIDSGVGRLLRFADELQDLASHAGETQDVFDPVPAISDAITAVAAETGVAPILRPVEATLQVIGVRSRFILAILNLLRNAYQAAPVEAASVAVDVATQRGNVRITIDDKGPGVPGELREIIFVDGYSMRHGGSGHGLALGRTIIEDDMGGTLTCEDGSMLGGGRFVITLPPHNGSAR